MMFSHIRLADISVDVSYGYTASAESDPVGPKFLRITDIRDGSIDWDTVPYCTIDEKSLVKTKLEIGDIVVARTGATTGINQIIKQDKFAVFASYLIRFRIDKNIADPFFIGYYLKSKYWNDHLGSIIGGSAQPGANAKQFGDFTMDLPPLPTQKAIAEILSSLDSKIELNNQINQNLEALAQALFKQWFVDFEFPNENGEPYKSSGGEMIDSELGEIPKGWRVYNFGELLTTISKTYPLKKVEEVIFLNTGDIQNGKFLHKNYSRADQLPGQAKKSIQLGDILYSEIRPQNKRFAYVHFNAESFVVSTKLMVLRPKVNIDPFFMYFLLTQDDTIRYLQILAESRSGTFPQITFSEVSTLKVALPSFEEVNSFSNKILDPYFEHSFNKDFENESLSELRDTLLPKLLSGELEVNESLLEQTF